MGLWQCEAANLITRKIPDAKTAGPLSDMVIHTLRVDSPLMRAPLIIGEAHNGQRDIGGESDIADGGRRDLPLRQACGTSCWHRSATYDADHTTPQSRPQRDAGEVGVVDRR